MQSGYTGIIMVIVLFGLMYFLMIRPQKKRQQKHANTLKKLKKGDQVVTVGRLHGQIDTIDRKDHIVTLDCDGIYLTFDLRAIASVQHSQTVPAKPAKKSKSKSTKAKSSQHSKPNSKSKPKTLAQDHSTKKASK